MEDSKRLQKFYGRPGEDYHLWAARTEAALESKEVLDVVKNDIVGSGDALTDEQKLAVAKVRAMLIQRLGDKPLRLCLSERENPHKMWTRLSDRYAISNLVTRVQLHTKLSRFSYSGQPMPDYIDDFEEVFNRLSAMESPVSEQMQVAMVLASFGDKSKPAYGQVVASLQMKETEVSWETATARLLQEYEEKVWASDGNSKRNIYTAGGRAAALSSQVYSPAARYSGKKKPDYKHERRRCFEWNEIGHIARNCSHRRKEYK